MKHILAVLLPASAGNTILGMKLPIYLFMLLAVISTVRSCIHLFAADGGAGSIAGMNLDVEGAGGIIFAFALWGSSQLIYAFIQLVVAFRYQSLVPAMYLLLIVETLLRELVGWELTGQEIAREFRFKDFHQTMAFVNAVAWVSHREDHHPDLEVGYNRCRVRYSTHAVGGLSENDFICAAKVNELVKV